MNTFHTRSLLKFIWLLIITNNFLLSILCKPTINQELIDSTINKSTTIFQLTRHGLGSNLINMLAFKSHFESINHKFIVDESHYYYKYKGEGVFKAFFSPSFRVFDDLDEYNTFIKANAVSSHILTTHSGGGSFYHWIRGILPIRGPAYHELMSKEACVALKFSAAGQLLTNDFKKKNGIPEFSNTVSVGFHVRRGDKILNEASKVEGKEYVNKLLTINTTKPIDNCFVATDDYKAVIQIRRALRQKKIGCNVYSLVKPNKKGSFEGNRSDEEVLTFITELRILSKVTYFIGTFSSNVGTLVSMLRSCDGEDKSHYAQSYSVDGQDVYWH